MADKNLTSTEALLMLPLAILFDVCTFAFGFIDWADFGLIGWLINFLMWTPFYLWMKMRRFGTTKKQPEDTRAFMEKKQRQYKTMQQNPQDKKSIANVKAKAGRKVKKAITSFLKKYGLSFVAKSVPLLGDFWPGFTVFVWQELGR